MKKNSVRYTGLAIMALLGIIFLTTPASAQYRDRDDNRYRNNNQNRDNNYGNQGSQVAINNGYQLGYGQGSNDRAFGHSYKMNTKVYRDADSGSRNSGI